MVAERNGGRVGGIGPGVVRDRDGAVGIRRPGGAGVVGADVGGIGGGGAAGTGDGGADLAPGQKGDRAGEEDNEVSRPASVAVSVSAHAGRV